MKAHQNVKVSQLTTFKNMWVHKYSYFWLLFNIKKLGKISKPPCIILQFTRAEHISSLIYKESPELLIPETSATVNSQYSLAYHVALCLNILSRNGHTILEYYCLTSNFFRNFKMYLIFIFCIFYSITHFSHLPRRLASFPNILLCTILLWRENARPYLQL